MPRVEKFFGGTKVSDWTSGGFGAGGGDNILSGGETNFYTDGGVDYISHTFNASSNFTVHSGALDIDYVVVAGGGAVSANSGGGGAGGFRTFTSTPVSATGGPAGNGVYPIVIGAGGTQQGSDILVNGKGSDSSGFGTTSTGGGGGGYYTHPNTFDPLGDPTRPNYGQKGGSGGGAGGSGPGAGQPGSGNSPPTSPSQGNNGGTAAMSAYGGGMGGGGGAGANGSNGIPFNFTPTGAIGGVGGAGSPTVYKAGPGAAVVLGGGGGGGGNSQGAVGGAGGGGSAVNTAPLGGLGPDPIHNGTANTGGGAGGTPNLSGNSTPRESGFGGSGVVILRYALS